MFSLALCRVLFGQRQYKHLTSVFLRYLKSQFPPRKHVLMSLGLSYPVYLPATKASTALSDLYRLFTTIVYLAIQVACFDAIFDFITNTIGRLFNLHIVKSTPNNQTWKKTGFLYLYSDVNVTFYVFICFHLVA